jgi:mannosylglycerate hydrolase
MMILNKGLPEYEAINVGDGEISVAVTLLRSIGWLSRHDLASRGGNAGPPITVPGAQCIGKHTAELAIITSSKPWLEEGLYWRAEEYHAPLTPAVPQSIGTMYRLRDTISLIFGTYFKTVKYEETGQLSAKMGLLQLHNPCLTMTACKKAEKINAIIIRIVNLSDKPQQDLIDLMWQFNKVAIANLNEDTPVQPIKASAALKGNQLEIKLEPFVIATIKLIL